MTRFDTVAEQMRNIEGRYRQDFAMKVARVLTARDAEDYDPDVLAMIEDSMSDPSFALKHESVVRLGILGGATPAFYKPVDWATVKRILKRESSPVVVEFIARIHVVAGELDDPPPEEWIDFLCEEVADGVRPDDDDEHLYSQALSNCFIPLYELLVSRARLRYSASRSLL